MSPAVQEVVALAIVVVVVGTMLGAVAALLRAVAGSMGRALLKRGQVKWAMRLNRWSKKL